jgi:hypothetical protein
MDRFSFGLSFGRVCTKVPDLIFSYPAFVPYQFQNEQQENFSQLLLQWSDVVSRREQAFRQIHSLANAIAAMEPTNPRYGAARFAVDYSRDHFEQADQTFRALAAKLDSPASGTNDTFLELVRLGWLIRKLTKPSADSKDTTLLVFARVVSSGGHYRTTRSIFQWLGLSRGLSASGGAVVQYAIFTPDGKLLDTGNICPSQIG